MRIGQFERCFSELVPGASIRLPSEGRGVDPATLGSVTTERAESVSLGDDRYGSTSWTTKVPTLRWWSPRMRRRTPSFADTNVKPAALEEFWAE
jgi:hypothetical protein